MLALKDDNAIPLNKKIAKPFLESIGNTSVKWRGQSRANGISEDIVKIAAQAGCSDLGIGIESVSPKVLKIINKKIDLGKAKEYIEVLKKYGIGTRLHFILGLPGEPNDIAARTLDFINETEPKSVILTVFTPLPGSEIFDSPKKFGIKNINPNWRGYQSAFGRFDENEKPKMMFEYESMTPWGQGISNEKILEGYSNLQAILRERKLIF